MLDRLSEVTLACMRARPQTTCRSCGEFLHDSEALFDLSRSGQALKQPLRQPASGPTVLTAGAVLTEPMVNRIRR